MCSSRSSIAVIFKNVVRPEFKVGYELTDYLNDSSKYKTLK